MGEFDPMDSDREREDLLRPHAIEYAESEFGTSPQRRELDKKFVDEMERLNFDADSDEHDIDDDDEHQDFLQRQKELKRLNRISRGSSIGKRAASERSDSDKEDLRTMDGRECGIGDRRTRRRVGDRWSGQFQFQDPPPERIPEMPEIEDDSCDDELEFGSRLAMELPYYDIEDMEEDE